MRKSAIEIEEIVYRKFPTIDLGNGYILRQPEMTENDILSIYKIYNDPNVTIFVPDGCIPVGIEGAKEEVRHYANVYLFRTAVYWFIADKITNQAIGTCGFCKWDRYNSKLEISYNLMSEYHNMGIMTQVINKAIEYGFNVIHAKRIEAQLDPSNFASIHILEKNGFAKDGLLRSYRLYKNNEHIDVLMMSIINPNF